MAGILKCDQVQSDSNLAFAIAGSNVAFMNATSLQMVGSNVSLAGTNVITNGKVVTAAQPVGSILQVVQGTLVGGFSTSSSSFVDTGLTVTITPTSASNKILVMFLHPVPLKGATNSDISLILVRNGTTINTWGDAMYTPGITNNYGTQLSGTQLDSPATTSAVTYKTQLANGQSSSLQVYACSSGTSTIVAMEIAG
jgi:hypothetical protein